MTEKPKAVKKDQISLEEYSKIKEKRAKGKLKLHFPLVVKIAIIIPAVYFTFLMLYFVIYLRFLAEH